ncbi:gp53-like domain-containing protein [Escherichia coli]|uniref:gp53-like domain-containing protein n=1 Tax=Escherichia coli TaxID=562 RepID=UPI003F75E34C
MATNDFKPFATGSGANVLSQADWEALPALLSGFTAGKASSAQVNKAIRQATTIAALVGQFIANSGADALDNADVNGLVTKFTNALTTNLGLVETINKASGAMQKSANGADISDVSAFRNALQLGTVATRDVGAGSINGIPDMSSFRGSLAGNGYIKIPIIGAGGGAQTIIIQWGLHSTPPGSNAAYNLTVAFPNSIVWATGGRGSPGTNASMNVRPEGTQQIRIQNYAPSGPYEDCLWIAIGY